MFVLEQFYPNSDVLQCFDWIEDHNFEKEIEKYNRSNWDYIENDEFYDWYNRVLECYWKSRDIAAKN